MKNKQILTFLAVTGLLVALATTANPATGAQAAAPSLVGTWNTTIPKSEGNPRPTFESMMTITADGNMVETNTSDPATNAPAHGVWIRSGNGYLMTFEAYAFDEKGKNTGKVRAHLTIKMDGPDHFTAAYTADLFDLAGKVTKKVVYGTSDSTRMKVEMP